MLRILWVINPSSGRQNMKALVERVIGRCTLANIASTYDVFFTEKKDDAFQRCAALKSQDADLVIAVGGDGTVNEVIGGIIESHSDIPLAIIPGGTVNDFATYLGLPRSADAIVRMLKEKQTTKVDIGRINHQYFANVVAAGTFSDVSYRVPKSKKARYGPLAYYVEAATQIPELFKTSYQLVIRADDKVYEENALLFLISNTRNIAGFSILASLADVHDGYFDMMVIRKCELTDMIALSKDILLNKHLNSPFLSYIQARKITVEGSAAIPVDIDGEVGPSLPFTLENLHQALTLVVPKKAGKS